jgi:hypothetical protein
MCVNSEGSCLANAVKQGGTVHIAISSHLTEYNMSRVVRLGRLNLSLSSPQASENLCS